MDVLLVVIWIILICLVCLRCRLPRSPRDSERAATHEAGHALAVWINPYVSEFKYATIIPDADFDGRTSCIIKKSETVFQTMGVVTISLAGIAAEIEIYGRTRAGGSAEDLIIAHQHARKLINRHGMHVVRSGWESAIRKGEKLDIARMFRSPPTADVRDALNAGYGEALRLIQENRAPFDRIRAALLEKKILTGADLEKMFGRRPWAIF